MIIATFVILVGVVYGTYKRKGNRGIVILNAIQVIIVGIFYQIIIIIKNLYEYGGLKFPIGTVFVGF